MIDYRKKSNEYLLKKREELMDRIEKDMREEKKVWLWNLLEVERELTLREY